MCTRTKMHTRREEVTQLAVLLVRSGGRRALARLYSDSLSPLSLRHSRSMELLVERIERGPASFAQHSSVAHRSCRSNVTLVVTGSAEDTYTCGPAQTAGLVLES